MRCHRELQGETKNPLEITRSKFIREHLLSPRGNLLEQSVHYIVQKRSRLVRNNNNHARPCSHFGARARECSRENPQYEFIRAKEEATRYQCRPRSWCASSLVPEVPVTPVYARGYMYLTRGARCTRNPDKPYDLPHDGRIRATARPNDGMNNGGVSTLVLFPSDTPTSFRISEAEDTPTLGDAARRRRLPGDNRLPGWIQREDTSAGCIAHGLLLETVARARFNGAVRKR